MSNPIQTTPGCNTDLVDGQSLVESLLRENKALKEQNAQLQQSLADALLQVEELEEELLEIRHIMWD